MQMGVNMAARTRNDLVRPGFDPEIAFKILRHADSAVTRRHYIMLESHRQGRKAMRKLESLVAKKVKTTKTRKQRSK